MAEPMKTKKVKFMGLLKLPTRFISAMKALSTVFRVIICQESVASNSVRERQPHAPLGSSGTCITIIAADADCFVEDVTDCTHALTTYTHI